MAGLLALTKNMGNMCNHKFQQTTQRYSKKYWLKALVLKFTEFTSHFEDWIQ